MRFKGLLQAIVVAVAMMSSNAFAQLIAHYTFDDGNGTTAVDSVAGNNATIKNWNTGVTTGNWVAGAPGFGGAYNFNGTDSADTPTTALNALLVNNNVTVAYWKKGNSLPNNSTYPYAEDFQVSGMNLHGWASWNPFVMGGAVYQSGNAGSGFSDQIGAPAPVTLNDWHHYAIVKDRAAGSVKLYIDGSLAGTNAGANANFAAPGKFDIGSSIFGGAAFHGAIDDFRIYDVPLTNTQVNALSAPQPIAHYKFDDASGTTAVDSVAGNNSTIKNWNTGVTTGGWVPGKVGGAYNFNGTDSADTPTTALNALLVNNNVTVAYWKKGNNLPANSTYPYAEDFQVSGMNLHGWASWNPFVGGGTVYQSANAGSGFSDQIGAAAPVSLNDWHHYAIVKDRAAGTVKLYVDGALVGTNAAANANFAAPGKFDIGSSVFGGSAFQGAIDDFRIYDVPLTLTQIRSFAVPEPTSMALFCLVGLVLLRSKR